VLGKCCWFVNFDEFAAGWVTRQFMFSLSFLVLFGLNIHLWFRYLLIVEPETPCEFCMGENS
jgi:hypothetical protein